MTADNRLSLQQPGGRIADEKLGIPAIHPKHFKALVPGLIADFEQVHAAFNGGGHQARPQRMRAESCRIERQTRRAGLHDVSHDASGEPLSADTLRSPVQYPPE